MNEEELSRVQAEYARLRPRYEEFGDALRVLLAQLVKGAAIEIEPISVRTKEVSSLIEKLRRKADYGGLDDIIDKCGLRIVTRYHGDVAAVCALIESELTVRETVEHGRTDSQVFGYASRHVIVELDSRRRRLREWERFRDLHAEIQVRSILQHAWASISHGLDYKTGAEVPASVRRKLFRVAALLETGDELFNDFRTDVAQLKSDYRDDVERDEWRQLELDRDSLLAAWDRLPMAELAEAAIESGWRSWIGGSERNYAGQLIAAAPAAGVRSLGALAEELDRIVADKPRLRALADESEKEGWTPYAIAPDVATLALLSRDGNGRVREALVGEDLRYRSELMKAAEEVSRRS